MEEEIYYCDNCDSSEYEAMMNKNTQIVKLVCTDCGQVYALTEDRKMVAVEE